MPLNFAYPEFDENGHKSVCKADSNMLMDIDVYKLAQGAVKGFASVECETAILLMRGALTLVWGQHSEVVTREDIFSPEPWCLHIPRGCPATVTAMRDSEIYVQKTPNDREFPAKLYRPEDAEYTKARYEQWEGTAKRDIITIFEYKNAPWSNMVIGEVITHPGRWSSYPPHGHPQPEVYYYRFDKPQGFGAGFTGDDVHIIKDGAAAFIADGVMHPQVSAPGYKMYYVWSIRHLEGDPWDSTRIDVPEHAWLYGVK